MRVLTTSLDPALKALSCFKSLKVQCFQDVGFQTSINPCAPLLYSEGGALTRFEVDTALAFRAMADAGVDAAIVEAGLGGELDATNVVPAVRQRRRRRRPSLNPLPSPNHKQQQQQRGSSIRVIDLSRK